MTGLRLWLRDDGRRPDRKALLAAVVALAVLLPFWWLAALW